MQITGATETTITLNGVAFLSGTEITADGTYDLIVEASDAAGNTASEAVGFLVASLDSQIEAAPDYVYDPAYIYVGEPSLDTASNTFTSIYSLTTFNPGAMNDMARYLGALYRQGISTITSIEYDGVTYTWDDSLALKGSNWTSDGTLDGTLVSAVTASYLSGDFGPYTFTVADAQGTEDFTLAPVINAVVTNQAELEAALANTQIGLITFGNSFTTDAQIHVMRDVTIDGAGSTLGVSVDLGTTNGSKHALSVEGATATLKDLTIDSASFAYGFNTYDEAVVTLENVSLLNSKGAGLTVNGSAVTATGLNTSDSAWGGVNVDPGSGVTADSVFTLVSGTLAELVQIWSDTAAAGTPVVTVDAVGFTSLVDPDTDVTVWSDRSYTVTATAGDNGAISPATTTNVFGSEVSVTVTPDAGYYLSELTVDGVAVAPQSPYVIPALTADHVIVATFSALEPVYTADITPMLADTPTPGAWVTDRFAPAGFESFSLSDENVIRLSIAASDLQASPFYNTQGRKYALPDAAVVSADVFLPAGWDTGSHRVGLWATAVDDASDITGYPIVDFYNDGTTPVFRVWDNLGWHEVDTAIAYGQWYNFRIQHNADSVTYYIDDVLVYESTFAVDTDMATSVGFSEMILQGYNFGADDAVYFDNVVPVPAPGTAVVTNQAELEAALANTQIGLITFGNSFTTDAQIHVMRDVTIDGAGSTLGVSVDLGTTNGSKHALSVEGATATLKDLTIDSASFAYGFNTYDEAVVTLENVSLLNSKGAGLTVNGSAVTATGLNTSDSAWGGVNVDPGSGVTADSVFTLVSGTLAELVQIWSDTAAAGTPVVTVDAVGFTSLVDPDNDVTVWSDR